MCKISSKQDSIPQLFEYKMHKIAINSTICNGTRKIILLVIKFKTFTKIIIPEICVRYNYKVFSILSQFHLRIDQPICGYKNHTDRFSNLLIICRSNSRYKLVPLQFQISMNVRTVQLNLKRIRLILTNCLMINKMRVEI